MLSMKVIIIDEKRSVMCLPADTSISLEQISCSKERRFNVSFLCGEECVSAKFAYG